MTTTRIALLLLVIWPCLVHGQHDAALWTGFSVNAPVNKRFELSASPEVRLFENLSKVQSAFIDLGAQRELNKYLFVSANYRIGGRNNDDYYLLRQRISLGLGLKYSPGDFRFSWQCKIQASRTGAQSETDPDFASTLRNKFSVKYSGLKKTDLASSFEIFNESGQYGDLHMTDWRWQCAIERRVFNKRNSVSLGYLIQRDLDNDVPGLDFIILVGYQWETGILKKKKETTDPVPVN